MEYNHDYMRPYQGNSGYLVHPARAGGGEGEEDEDELHRCPRLIDAEYMHGGQEQEFWGARQQFRRSGARAKPYYPTWDRQAQVMLAFVQRVPRVPAIAAFRLFVYGLKCLLLPQLTTSGGGAGAGHLLPLRMVGVPALKMGVLLSSEHVQKTKDLENSGGGGRRGDEKKEEKEKEGCNATASSSSSSSADAASSATSTSAGSMTGTSFPPAEENKE